VYYERRERRQQAPGDAVVLMYHRVVELELDRWRLAVAPSRFSEHLEVIAERFRPGSLRELSTALEAGALSRRSVALTFDDGYRDNLEAAKPRLEQHGVPATFFIASGYLGSERGFWWDELEQLHGRSDLPEAQDYPAAWSRLRELPHQDRVTELDRLWEQAGLEPERNAPILTPAELNVLDTGDLIEVGAHTVTHPRLPGLSREAQLTEIGAGKEQLEQVLGRPVESFAYPFGEYDGTSVECVRAARLRYACAAGERSVTKRSALLEIPRVLAPDVSGEELEKILESRLR
jgi:peptidoglycan/xylan/chitin deacetylase (PgdA/CDA1 family)